MYHMKLIIVTNLFTWRALWAGGDPCSHLATPSHVAIHSCPHLASPTLFSLLCLSVNWRNILNQNWCFYHNHLDAALIASPPLMQYMLLCQKSTKKEECDCIQHCQAGVPILDNIMYSRMFLKRHLAQRKFGHSSMHSSREHINQILKLYFQGQV